MENAFHNVCDLADDVDLNSIASDYQMAGGQIINVLRQCALTAIRRNERIVYQQDIISGIRNEFKKTTNWSKLVFALYCIMHVRS